MRKHYELMMNLESHGNTEVRSRIMNGDRRFCLYAGLISDVDGEGAHYQGPVGRGSSRKAWCQDRKGGGEGKAGRGEATGEGVRDEKDGA